MKRYGPHIAGAWREGGGPAFDAVDPYRGSAFARIGSADADDVDAAVRAARTAVEGEWGRTPGVERGRLLQRLAALVSDAAEDLGRIETTDNGKILRESVGQARFAARGYEHFAGFADNISGRSIPLDSPTLLDYTTREPYGVAALITAWNSPVQLLANKLAPALATGNAVVIKPSEHASVSTLEFVALAEQAGFPPGTINVVTGAGGVGAALSSHPGIDLVSFTGGVATGRAVAEAASRNLVPATLELGGKSANIVFADSDPDCAVPGALAAIFSAAGQSCIAGSRLLVERAIFDDFVARLVRRADAIRLGDPFNAMTQMGPIANEPQWRRIRARIEQGLDEGGRIATSAPFDVGSGPGFFVRPTIFVDVTPEMQIVREEVFGPVLVVLPFEDEEEAVRIANDTPYGLAAGIWTSNLSRAHSVARRLDAGTVWVNTYRTLAAQAPAGGIKSSGHGRERGVEALDDFVRVKNVMIELDPRPAAAWSESS